jgi:CRP/FNR family cyclic AMP-dependent transcriptional regulator
MHFPEAVFQIIGKEDCPLFHVGDEFKLSGRSMFFDHMKEKELIINATVKFSHDLPTCRTLISDIVGVLIQYGSMDDVPKHTLTCGGCSGTVTLLYVRGQKPPVKSTPRSHEIDIDAVAQLLVDFSIFQTLDEGSVKKFVSFLKLKKYSQEEIIIKKGDPGRKFFIIVSGKVEVIGDDNVRIAVLGPEEVFGEMSLLSGDPVGATIKVAKPTTVLFLEGRDFLKVLGMFPSLQLYFARMLARRLANTNVEISKEFTSGVVGKLSDLSPSELFQTLNLNQKTGVLKLSLSKGPATVSFHTGSVVRAKYLNLEDADAFYEILKARKGRFQFQPGLSANESKAREIGNFMWLLMEGLRRADETSNVETEKEQ